MTVSFYLTRPKAEETSIFARISYGGYRFKYYLPEKIKSKFWNSDTQRAKQTEKFKEYPEFNTRINNIEGDIRDTFRTYTNDNGGMMPNPDTFKELLDKVIKKIEQKKDVAKTFFAFFEAFNKRSLDGERINVKSKKGTVYNTAKGYVTVLNHIKDFQAKYRRKLDFDKIDLEFYNDYTKYLTKELKLSNNTIGDHIKRIKTVMNEATELGINKNLAFKSRYFTKLQEQTTSIYLTETEINALAALDLIESKKLENVRDLFVIGCYTGLRYSDYSLLTPENIKDGFIETTQQKTGMPIVIPVHPTVKAIIEKYNGHLPKAISNQKTNDYLKDIGKKLDCLKVTTSKTITKGGVKVIESLTKWEQLTTHTARRSFATNEYLAGTPTITIMAITGHTTEKAFMRYIKLTPNEHAKILKLHWAKRKEDKEAKETENQLKAV